MKKLITVGLCLLMLSLFSCAKQHLKQFEKKDHYFDNSSVLGLNAINADNNYYTKSILEYLLVKGIIDGNSEIRVDTPKFSPTDTSKVVQMVLFPDLQHDDLVANNNFLLELWDNGLRSCIYDLPKELDDLKSGFQFNHYVFKGSNRAAMQAFGIVAGEVKDSTLYMITDYLQYQDISCTGFPTIRYAVGMRAQFRIAKTNSETELKGISSLAGLAAQVETDQRTVNITIKTIGITGIDSRLTIPSNTTFDVKTYSDYEKILDFIRNLKQEKDKLGDTLIIQPQIIPVMDDYRPTIEHTFHPTYEAIELLETKLNYLEGKREHTKEVEDLRKEIKVIKVDLLKKEINDLKINRDRLIHENSVLNDYSRNSKLLDVLNKFYGKETGRVEEKIVQNNKNNNKVDEYVIVFSADSNFEQAKHEKEKFKNLGIESRILLRKNSFRNISKSFPTLAEAEKYKNENGDNIRFDAYIIDFNYWCPIRSSEKNGYSICE